MFFFEVKVYFRIVKACWSTFGFSKTLFRFLFFIPTVNLINKMAFSLDNVIYPAYRSVKVEKPIFIIGHPRSGTTFLHRILTQTGEFVVFTFWETVFPSLVARKIFAPFKRRRINKGKGTVYPKEVGHEITLDSMEEEEALFYQIYNTQLLALTTPLGFADRDFKNLVFSDRQPLYVRRKTTRFLKQCFQRQMYYLNKSQVVAKMNYSGMRIKSLLEAFPDAKIIYIVRSPYETIASHLSLHRNMFDHRWGLENIPKNRLQRYYKRRYEYNVIFYRYFDEFIEKGQCEPDQLMTLTYDLLKNDLEKAVDTVVEFTGIELSDDLRSLIQQEVNMQRSYRPKHHNLELEKFGLSKAKIAKDLSFIFDKYGFQK